MEKRLPTSEFNRQNMATADIERLVYALDMQEANDAIRRLRAWAHAAVAARPGERALDIGSGTGSETRALAAAVAPDGEAIGIEPNPAMRAVAETRAAESPNPPRFIDGDALALPLPDASVDVVWCERVLQHLSEPDKAVGEMARVLRPGGRVVLLDTDWATSIVHPGDPGTVAALHSNARAMAANPYAGRRLAGQLTAAGLKVIDRGSQALQQDEVPWPLLNVLADSAIQQNQITESQRDRLYADLTEAAEQGALHMSVTIFGVVANRPG